MEGIAYLIEDMVRVPTNPDGSTYPTLTFSRTAGVVVEANGNRSPTKAVHNDTLPMALEFKGNRWSFFAWVRE